MDIIKYLQNYPIDYIEIEYLLHSDKLLTKRDLDKLNILCIDYRLQQINAQNISSLINLAKKEIDVRKVMMRYEHIPSLFDVFDFLFLCMLTNEMSFFDDVLKESSYAYLLDFPNSITNRSTKNIQEYTLIWEILIYYYYCRFTNKHVDMEYIDKFFSKDAMTDSIERFTKCDSKNTMQYKYNCMVCCGYLLIYMTKSFELSDCWNNVSMYFSYEKNYQKSFDNIIEALNKVDFTIEPLVMEYLKKVMDKVIIASKLGRENLACQQ